MVAKALATPQLELWAGTLFARYKTLGDPAVEWAL